MSKKSAIKAGEKYGKLTAIEYAGYKLNNSRIWKFKCDCGAICYKRAGNVKHGQSQNCGSLICSKPRNRSAESVKAMNAMFGNNEGKKCYFGRLKLQLSVTEFAKMCGLTAPTISELEFGKKKRIRQSTMEKLNKILPDAYKITNLGESSARPNMKRLEEALKINRESCP